MKIISSGCDPRATLGEIIDLPFLGSAAVGASPLESADPGGGPACGAVKLLGAGGWGQEPGPMCPRRGVTFADRHQVFSPGALSGACRGPGGVPEGFARRFGVVRELILGSISTLCGEFGSSFG